MLKGDRSQYKDNDIAGERERLCERKRLWETEGVSMLEELM